MVWADVNPVSARVKKDDEVLDENRIIVWKINDPRTTLLEVFNISDAQVIPIQS